MTSGQAAQYFYLLMEFVDGVNLRQAMRAGRFTPEQALGLVPKICDELQYAHGEGFLHHDIKLDNILLDARGRVKIADFGIGKLAGESEPPSMLTRSGMQPREHLFAGRGAVRDRACPVRRGNLHHDGFRLEAELDPSSILAYHFEPAKSLNLMKTNIALFIVSGIAFSITQAGGIEPAIKLGRYMLITDNGSPLAPFIVTVSITGDIVWVTSEDDSDVSSPVSVRDGVLYFTMMIPVAGAAHWQESSNGEASHYASYSTRVSPQTSSVRGVCTSISMMKKPTSGPVARAGKFQLVAIPSPADPEAESGAAD